MAKRRLVPTNSTVSPELSMPQISAPDLKPSSSDAEGFLSLLSRLEATLEASQKALLARDLAGLQLLIREQHFLVRAFFEFSSHTAIPASSKAEVCTAAMRVLALGRTQRSLLDRMQRFLRALGHLVAGPTATYSQPLVPARMGQSPTFARLRKEG